VLLGTFAVLQAFGYSINVLTMFGMVLAIGLLVDDAIVVVENVERVMQEEGLSAREATRKSMEQITGALIGIALVLTAVFLPMSFFGGSTGVIYRQFSITMMSAMVLSVVVALIFTPALCATLLKPPSESHHGKGGIFGWFNRTFERGSQKYERGVRRVLNRTGRYMIVFVVIVGLMALLFTRVPTSFLPDEDQGIVFVQVTTPEGSTRHHAEEALHEVLNYFQNEEKEAVEGVFTITGFNFAGRGQNSGMAFVRLKPWEDRHGARNRAQAVVDRANQRFRTIAGASVLSFSPPAVSELGNATGFDFELLDRANQGHEKLMEVRDQLLSAVGKDTRLTAVRANGLDDEPQYQFNVDWERASAMGLTITDINNTVSAAWGSQHVNDFVDRGRVKRVFIQGDAPSRMLPQDLTNWYVRNSATQMVPLSAFSAAKWGFGSPKLERYNGVSSVEILGQPIAGVSTGTALDAMEGYAKQLPPEFDFEWTGLSYEERLSGSQAPALYAVSVMVVFLCLAALYESWSIPLAVMLVVPLGVIGAIAATLLRGLANDVFFQVGLLTTVGLSAKNAILIIEFAKENHEKGMELIEATVHASRQRLRPILMTSLAFILGVLPLAISRGAGSGGQNAIGTGVIGGMLSATVLAILLVPVFFVVMRRLVGDKPAQRNSAAQPDVAGAGEH
jgi:multidrug efflux pump